jgi:hypothetical protein
MPESAWEKTEPAAAALVAVLGMAMTTWGAVNHGGPWIAPGATLIVVGGAWLGNALARRDVDLFRSSRPERSQLKDDVG